MKYIKQFTIILFVSLLGEVLNYLLPLPIPASIYGIVLMFAALLTGVISLDAVRETGKFLIAIMPIMFVAPAVSLMDSWDVFAASAVKYVALVIISTILAMGITGVVTQLMLRAGKGSGKAEKGAQEGGNR
jgi:holin-like protein